MAAVTSPLVYVVERVVPAAAATADTVSVVGRMPYAATLTKVTYVPAAGVTGAASPASRTLSVVDVGTGGVGVTVAASYPLVSASNLTALIENTIPLSGTAANLVVAAGDIVSVNSTHVGGTGLADPGGLVHLEFTRN